MKKKNTTNINNNDINLILYSAANNRWMLLRALKKS